MPMSRELAEKVLARGFTRRNILTDQDKADILLEWLNGVSQKDIAANRKIAKATVGRVIKQAREEAERVLGRRRA